MYHLTPFTYLIEGLVVNALGGIEISCTAEQFNVLTPPAGVDCLAFLEPFVSARTGYAEVVNGVCSYCPYKTGDQFFETLNMSFSHRYRDAGFLWLVLSLSLLSMSLRYFDILDDSSADSYFSVLTSSSIGLWYSS